ncbi:MAG: hypothetical protein JNN00_19130 [Chitinophagaceae bacterium]|nr:hypothetical protein [Chitinophagaceae bacterium]
MATIVHFDISAEVPERAKKFYTELFGWKMGTLDGFPDYYEIETADTKGVKGVGGGLTKRDDPLQNGIVNFIGVDSLSDTLTKLVALGGRVIQPRQAMPGYGYIAVCADTENNTFGLFQDDKNAR